MASAPESHPDSKSSRPSGSPEQVSPGADERENVEEPSPSDDSGFHRDDGSDALV